MAFMGSFGAFTVCIIGPVSVHICLHGARWWDIAILIMAIVMAIWGTAAVFTSF
jgi:vesicular inhibitory amino acid transporter